MTSELIAAGELADLRLIDLQLTYRLRVARNIGRRTMSARSCAHPLFVAGFPLNSVAQVCMNKCTHTRLTCARPAARH
jgi:hypothetical protein